MNNLYTLRAGPVPFLAVHTAEDGAARESVVWPAGEDGHGVVVLLHQLHLATRGGRRSLKQKTFLHFIFWIFATVTAQNIFMTNRN